MMKNIRELLELCYQRKASDLHLSSGLAAMLRIDGEIQKLDFPILEDKTLRAFLDTIISVEQRKKYEEKGDLDFSLDFSEHSRFRVNVFRQNRGVSAAFRHIPKQIPRLEELELPNIIQSLLAERRGLILVTGPTGSGKSTTLAAMIDYLNRNRALHILSLEDPLEFIHESQKSLISQREIFRDTPSFSAALPAALREDPDVLVLGELRDLDSIRLALTAAETGHLVLASLHTASAAKTIDRLIDVFPGDEKAMVRALLSESLKAVISQSLVKRLTGGRVAAVEVMLVTAAIRHLIRESKVAQLYSNIQTNRTLGMQTLDQHLQELFKKQWIAKQDARAIAECKELFN